jgi:hypothetical protein
MLPSLEAPERVRHVVVATDDPAIVDEIEVCLFDRHINALVLPLRDVPSPSASEKSDETLLDYVGDREVRQELASRLAIAAERGRLLNELRQIVTLQERLLTAASEYVGIVHDNLEDGTDPTVSIQWAEESLRRTREVLDSLRRLTDRLA